MLTFRFPAARLLEELFMVRPLVEADAEVVATIHITELRTHFCGSTGRKLLSCYYRALVKGRGAFSYVWANESEPVSGFICGIWDARYVRRALLVKEWPRLLFWGVLHVVSHPRLLAKLLGRLASSLRCTRDNCIPFGVKAECELRPIAVKANSRGRGVAQALLEAFLAAARARGGSSVNLKTEVDNERANAFYRKCGFRLESTSGGYNHYRLQL